MYKEVINCIATIYKNNLLNVKRIINSERCELPDTIAIVGFCMNLLKIRNKRANNGGGRMLMSLNRREDRGRISVKKKKKRSTARKPVRLPASLRGTFEFRTKGGRSGEYGIGDGPMDIGRGARKMWKFLVPHLIQSPRPGRRFSRAE